MKWTVSLLALCCLGLLWACSAPRSAAPSQQASPLVSSPLPALTQTAVLPPTGAVVMPTHEASLQTSTPDAGVLQHYPDDAFGVTFAFPAAWRKMPDYNDRYGGDDGFVTVDTGLTGGMWTIQSACEHVAGHKLQPYGSAPNIAYTTIDGRPACFIWPSADQDPGFEQVAGLVALPPQTIRIGDTTYLFLMLNADKGHLEAIARTVQFRRP